MADDQAPKPVPMFDSEGNLRDVPYEKMVEATHNGMKPAVSITFPSGKARYVPSDKLMEATSPEHGGRVNPLEDQPAKHPAWYQHVLSDAWGTVKGVLNAGPEAGVIDEEGGPGGRAARYREQLEKEGHGKIYSNLVSQLTPDSVVQRVNQGDVAGVASGMGVTAAAAAAGPLAAEHPMIQHLADHMTAEQLHQSLMDFTEDYHGTKLPPTDTAGALKRLGQKIWQEDSGEMKVPFTGGKKPPASVTETGAEAPKKPPQSVKDVANPVRDTATLKQVQTEHPDWTLSQQLQEAAKRVKK